MVADPGLGRDLVARCGEHLVEHGEDGGHVVGVGDVGEVDAVPRVARVAEEGAHLAHRRGDPTVGVDDGDHVGDVLHEGAPAVLALAQLDLGPVVLGDVHEDADHVGSVVVEPLDHRGPDPDLDVGAVLGQAGHLLALGPFVGEGAPSDVGVVVGVVGVDDRQGTAQHLLGGPAEGPLGGGVPDHEVALGVDAAHRDRDAGDESGQVMVRGGQGVGEALLVGAGGLVAGVVGRGLGCGRGCRGG